jgi:ABC-type Fe3+-hydroxamate transport system substrate-binding protein
LEINKYTDQLGREIVLPFLPRRIVSLVPSQTELLYELGASVVGITKFCVHPDEWFREKARVGGTKNVSIDLIRALAPDLIIANKEENDAAQVQALMQEFPVWVSDIKTLEDALKMITSIGWMTGTHEKAAEIIKNISAEFNRLPILDTPIRAAYLIWKNPWMVAGGDTFINNMMIACFMQNVFSKDSRYPVVTVDQIRESNCEVVLLSSEPYPFTEKHVAELQDLLPGLKILLVDGEMYSWYGSRLMHAPAYFSGLQAIIRP